MEFIFNVSSKVMLKPNISNETGQLLKEQGIQRVMVVFDPGLEGLGIVEKIIKSIEKEKIEVLIFNKVEPDPSYEIVDLLAKKCLENSIEGIVGIGGGSAMDTAKCANILLSNPGSVLDYAVIYDQVKTKGKYLILIPTTFGTASEITDGGVLTVPKESKKVTVWGKNIGGDLALIDPMIAVGIPPKITASTGMDSLAHAIEAYFTILATPITEALSLKAINLIINNLEECVFNGSNIEARTKMCMGSLMAGMAFNNAFLCQGHNLAHVLGARYHIQHGTACAIALPLVIKSNIKVAPNKVREIAQAFNLTINNKSDDMVGDDVIAYIIDFCKKIGIPKLSELGVNQGDFQEIAEAFEREPDKEYFLYIPSDKEIIDYLNEIYT